MLPPPKKGCLIVMADPLDLRHDKNFMDLDPTSYNCAYLIVVLPDLLYSFASTSGKTGQSVMKQASVGVGTSSRDRQRLILGVLLH